MKFTIIPLVHRRPTPLRLKVLSHLARFPLSFPSRILLTRESVEILQIAAARLLHSVRPGASLHRDIDRSDRV